MKNSLMKIQWIVKTKRQRMKLLQGRHITISTSSLIPMITEDLEWKKNVSVLKVNFIVTNVHGMIQILFTFLIPKVICHPVNKLPNRKIYHQYLETLNNQPEQCGCGTAAEIAYMGHHTECIEFQYIHERESFEVLFAILKKRRKVTFSGHTNIQTKRPRLDTMNENQPDAKGTPYNLSLPSSTTDSLSMLADTALNSANSTQSNTLPNSLPELVEDGTDCPCNDEDDEEMPALEDAD